jgi:hypothetical protein
LADGDPFNQNKITVRTLHSARRAKVVTASSVHRTLVVLQKLPCLTEHFGIDGVYFRTSRYILGVRLLPIPVSMGPMRFMGLKLTHSGENKVSKSQLSGAVSGRGGFS